MTLFNNDSSRTPRVIAIIFLSLSAIALGIDLGQQLLIAGHNYVEGTIFPGLVIILGLPGIIGSMAARKKTEKKSNINEN